MKASNKSSIITGVSLLCLAALFSICLITQAFDFGAGGPGHNNIFYLLGNVLYSVYGFSSILIPGFLLFSGLSCFATKWTARKTMRLITALIPFFTAVVTEKIIRSIVDLGKGSFSGLKILIALITGAMLIIIEYLGAGIIADKIQHSSVKKANGYAKVSKVSIPSAESNTKNDDEETPKHKSIFDRVLDAVDNPEQDAQEETSVDEEYDEYEEEYQDYNAEQTEEADESENPYASYEEELEQEDDEEEIDLDTEIANSADQNSEIDIPSFQENDEETTEEIVEDQAPAFEETSETVENNDSDAEESSKPNTMITQEEFAALTSPEEPADELEWPDLPPQPEKLPPEYDEDFDENDPDLEFPPKELPKEEKEKEEYNSNDPYAAARYVDSVVENPRFPHGIVIHDYGEQTEEDDDKESDPKEEKKSKFPSRINLYEDAVSTSSPEPEVEDDDDYVEDETLPMPEFDIEKPAITQIEEAQTALDKEIEFYEEDDDDETDENDSDESLQNFFNQVDPSSTVQDIDDPYEAEKTETTEDDEAEVEVESPVFNQIAQTEMESEGSLSETASDVFSDMEEDIRKSQPAKILKPVQDSFDEDEEEVADASDEDDNDDEEMDIPAQKSLSNSSNPLSTSATNLTADELTDFFHAQQEENKPKGSEILANPPKLDHTATKKGPYVIPSDLLTAYKDDEYWVIDEATKQAALNLKQTLAEFNIEAEIIGIKKGPVVTMFELLPAPGVKLSKIVTLQDNIALSLAAQSVRIVAPIPGKQAVGIEVPNRHRSVVGFREIIEMDLPEWKKMAVPVILGKDILGKAQLIDLVKTPHMLIAGATGSGKSVCVNSLILSILYKRSFKDVKMILVDPKVVELKLYNNIPHLLTPVITEPKKALQALKWALCEMERRYALLDQMGVRDISNYNQKIKDQKICTEKLPFIVIIIDEFADLMATSGKELESVIARLTAMSRAVGIHLVLATQRPSVNVITGLIKANIPTRIAFMVASRTDSNIIIDTVGAEKLLGRGDMLYASAVDPAPVRIQGTFVSDQEVEDVVRAVKEYGEPDYIDEEIFFDDEDDDGAKDLFGQPMDDDDPLYDQALEIVVQAGKASASYIQRRLKIGYNRAARLVEEMEERGIVGPANGSKPREVIHIP